MLKRRGKAKDRAAKKRHVVDEGVDEGEPAVEEAAPTYPALLLASAALRGRFPAPPPGLAPDEQARLSLGRLLAMFSVPLAYSKHHMKDAQDYTWPDLDLIHNNQPSAWTLSLAQLALALEDNDSWWATVPGPDLEAAYTIIRGILPKKADVPEAASPPFSHSVAQEAFAGKELPDSTGAYPSHRLKSKLEQYIAQYYAGEGGYHSPYASIVGPSGSGKTFSVKQLADREKMWVVYTSLSRVQTSVPAEGPIRSYLLLLGDEKTFSSFWDRYICAGLMLVELAQDEHVSPGALFRLQYHDDYSLFREAIAKLVGGTGGKPCTKLAVRKIVQETVGFETLRAWGGLQPDPVEAGGAASKTPIVFCVDEARGLLHVPADERRANKAIDGKPIAFRQLRHALARRGLAEVHRRAVHVFGLLLDTSSRVQNFSPPLVLDPSAKVGQTTELFPPLYSIHTTWDGVAKQSPQVQAWLATVISAGTVQRGPQEDNDWRRFLYSLGRPLWGALLEASLQQPAEDNNDNDEYMRLPEGIRVVDDLVHTKLLLDKEVSVEKRDQHHIALMLFRLQFYLSDHKLNEACVADWLHYVRHVSPDRSTIQTMQPGEPVLARYVMRKMKTSTSFREEMVKSLAKSLHYGALNVGDSGEIIAGLLLLLAADATPEEHVDQGVVAMHKSLVSFLETYVGWSPTAAANPLLATSRVHVTRIGRYCNRSLCITQRHLQVAFLTGEAWYLSSNFPGADILVPVWQGPGRPMTALLVQVKNKEGPADITQGIRLQARMALATGRKQIEALDMDPGLTVYGLFLNLRPLPPPPQAEKTRAEELRPDPTDGNLVVFVKLGFDQESYPFLAPGEYNVISGIVSSHIIDIDEEETRNLATMLDTRDGSTFLKDGTVSQMGE